MIKQNHLLVEEESELTTADISEDDALVIPYPQVTPEILQIAWQQ